MTVLGDVFTGDGRLGPDPGRVLSVAHAQADSTNRECWCCAFCPLSHLI